MILLLLLCGQLAADSREVIPGGKTHIVHIRDWHYVPKDSFAADLQVEGEELDKEYEKFLAEVKGVQASQRKLLAEYKAVYVEGLAPSDMPIFEAMLRVQKKLPAEEMALRIGAAGQLAAEGKIKVHPADAEGFEKANPVKDGKVELNEALIEEREDAIVKRLLKKKGKVVLILGGAHDLADNIKRLSTDCGYTVVTPKGYPGE